MEDYVPKDGVILKKQEVDLYKDDSVYDILKRELKKITFLWRHHLPLKQHMLRG